MASEVCLFLRVFDRDVGARDPDIDPGHPTSEPASPSAHPFPDPKSCWLTAES